MSTGKVVTFCRRPQKHVFPDAHAAQVWIRFQRDDCDQLGAENLRPYKCVVHGGYHVGRP